jgi:CheY-like chemotaxis protein
MCSALHVLLVDDDLAFCEVLSRYLTALGHLPVYVSSGVAALHKLHAAAAPFDLMITDHAMPGWLSGFDLVRLARAKGFDRQIVICSGSLPPGLKATYAQHEVLGFLPKPIEFQQLDQLIRTAAKLRPRGDEESADG